MAIRRKERPLTPDEIKEKLIQSTHEHWLHGDPLCGYTPLIDGGKIIPLIPKGENTIFLFFLLDAGDYATDRTLEILGKWQERYRKLPWTPVLIFRSKYLFQKNPRFFERFRQIGSFQALPLFIDPQDEWFEFFKVKGPTLVFSYQGTIHFNEPLNPGFTAQIEKAESKFQELLHLNDHGLPLVEVEPFSISLPMDHSSKNYTDVTQVGYWKNAGNGIATDDPNAKLSFSFSGTHLRFLAITHPQARENAKAQIFLDDIPLAANIHGEQVHPGDRGQSILEVNKHFGVYEIIASDRKIQGVVTIKFINTLENPVIFYELRMA